MYKVSWPLVLTSGTFSLFRLFIVVYKLVMLMLAMCCMYIPAFIVTSADTSQLWVYLCYLLYCLRLFVVVCQLVMLMERG